MSPISFRAEFDEGRSVEFVPTYTRPFGTSEIDVLEKGGSPALKMNLESEKTTIDGKEHVGHVRIKTDIIFHEVASIYALVPGGWLPLPFAVPERFLVDRNVVISLRKIREGKIAANAQALQWWIKFFTEGSGLFNPLPFAYEAGFRRKPTMTEFVAAYDEGVYELRSALPGSNVVRLEEAHYRAAYSQLEAFDEKNEREIRFLQATCPLVVQRVPRRSEAGLIEAIVSAADTHGVDRASLASLAVLSCLYEDVRGVSISIGRRILKPKQVYAESDAFNAISDLRHIELAAAGQAYFKNDAFSLCTCDRGLALLWSALSIRGEFLSGGPIEFTFDLTTELFSRLGDGELSQLRWLLRK